MFFDDFFLRNKDIKRTSLNDREFLEHEINAWKHSPERLMQIKGHLYFDGEHDILHRKRLVIGENGKLCEVKNLPNNRIVDNQYGKLVLQKANYLLGQPFVIETDNKQYAEHLKQIFDKRFMRLLKNAGKAALNGGLSWLYAYLDDGTIRFRLFPSYEILPFWRDSEHTELDCAVRVYLVQGYEGTTPVLIEKAEIYTAEGVRRCTLKNGTLIPDDIAPAPYISFGESGFNWERIPLTAVKYNEGETPLIKRIKTLQDGINVMLSDFENNLQEDARNTILVLKNYDGTNLGEFRRNLAEYGAVKVRCDGDSGGGVETLEIKVNAENYKAILELFKKALIENGMGFDAKDDRLSGNPNQMNIRSMYSDIDLDANDMETELQASFEETLKLVNAFLLNTGKGDFFGEKADIIFNRDMLMNESEAISDCQKSVGILSDETIISQHPWVDDPQAELERLEKQRLKEVESGYNPFEEGAGDSIDEK